LRTANTLAKLDYMKFDAKIAQFVEDALYLSR
jgi:hypothetical protein